KFALYPAETPANAAAIPATGCLPSAKKITAPSGGNTTYPALEAREDIIPVNTSPAVINDFGMTKINPLKAAEINHEVSAIRIPSIVVRNTAKGSKLIKLSTILSNIYEITS